MALWDSPDLLRLCKLTRRRKVSETTDAEWYSMLTQAEAQILGDLCQFVPREMVVGPVEMVTEDDGVTFSIPDSPDSVFEMLVMDQLNGRPLIPGSFFDEAKDYAIFEGTTIRMVLNIPVTYSDGPQAFYIPGPGEISATSESRIKPAHLRMLLAYRACMIDASRGGRDDPAFYQNLEHVAAWGGVGAGVGMVPALKKKHAMSGRSAFPSVEGLNPIWRLVF